MNLQLTSREILPYIFQTRKLALRLAKWQLCSVAQSCPSLCNTMDCSTPGFPVFHHLPESAQTHVHWVDDAIQPPHPQSPPPPPAFNLSTSGSFPMSWLFISGGQSTGVSASAKVLPVNIQGWLPLGLTDLISLLSKRLSRVFSSPSTYQMTLHLLWTDLSLPGLSLSPGLSLVCLQTKSAQKGPGTWQVFNRHLSSYPCSPLERTTPSPNEYS